MKYITQIPQWNKNSSLDFFPFLKNNPKIKLCGHYRYLFKSFVRTHKLIVSLFLGDYYYQFYQEVEEFDQWCQENNCDTQLIIISTVDYPAEFNFSKNIHWITMRSMYSFMMWGNQFNECNRKPIRKHFISLSSRPTWYRHHLFYYLHKNKLLDQGHVSYLFDWKRNDGNYSKKELFELTNSYIPPILIENLNLEEIYNQLPYKNFIEKNQPERSMEAWTTVQDFYNESAVAVETETYISNELENNAGFTEKILRPLTFGNPFLLFGAPGSLNTLRQIGFETYNNIIDESYDLVSNNINRFDYVLQELDRITKLSIKELILMLDSVNDVIEHNQNHALVSLEKQFQEDSNNLEKYMERLII